MRKNFKKYEIRYRKTEKAAKDGRLGEVSVPIGGAFSCRLCDRVKRPKKWRLAYSHGFCSRKCLEVAASLRILAEIV